MKSYLDLIPISARVHRRQNRMTLLCIIFAVFMVTAVFSMADMGVRMEQSRLADKHNALTLQEIRSTAMLNTAVTINTAKIIHRSVIRFCPLCTLADLGIRSR